MTAGSPRPSTHPAGQAADTRQTDAILTMLLAGRSLDYVCEQGATRAGGWTRARAVEVRDRLVADGRLPAKPPRIPTPPGVTVPPPRGHTDGAARRYRQMTDEQLLAHCRTHPAKTVRDEAATVDALLREVRGRLAMLRQNLPSVDEARELREGLQRRRGDRR